MLSSTGKKILLSIHIIFVSIWIGGLIVILLIQFTKSDGAINTHLVIVDRMIFTLFDVIIVNVSIAVAISGLVFSMFTKWGFFKFRWIIFKWLSILSLAVFIMAFTGPSINGMAALSDTFGVESYNTPDYLKFEKNVISFTILQLLLLILIVFISVIKPWGQREQKFKVNRKIVVSIGLTTLIFLIVSSIIQYLELSHYRNLPIGAIDLDKVEDGLYFGEAKYGFEYKVKVVVRNHSIKDIVILQNRDSFYAVLAEGIKFKIIREQRINPDAITGATTTSKILMKSIEDAIGGM